MTKKWKSFTGNILLVLTFTILGILAVELAVRFLHPQVTLFPRYVDSPDYSIAFPGNSELIHSQGNRWVFKYTTNDLGRRGPYLPASEEYDTNNVVVLGDSFTFGFGVNNGEVFTDIMAEQLGSDYFVINGGMGGWGIDSQIKWFSKIGASYKPKYAVLQFTANDPGDSYTGVTKIENGKFEFYPYTRKRPAWQLLISRSYLLQNSHLYAMFRKALDNLPAKNKKNGASSPNNKAELRYVEFLDLFARDLNTQGVKLIFLSVTHSKESPDGYHYDLDNFPEIENKVTNLASSGLLHFVELPLDQMQKYPGSPEGHQWSSVHHKIVGKETAKTISRLEEKTSL